MSRRGRYLRGSAAGTTVSGNDQVTDPIDLRDINSRIGDRYRLERLLGAGGMATVYLAEDLKHRRQVAIKILRPELAGTLGPDRFLREIGIAAQLNHPQILPLHDSGHSEGCFYYVMPVVSGESLRQRLNAQRQLSIDEALRIAQQVAAALEQAHRLGVIHRDIKPENIPLHEGEALVSDFGVALFGHAGPSRESGVT